MPASRRHTTIAFFAASLLACSAAPATEDDATEESESELKPSYCSASGKLLSKTTKTITSNEATARINLPACSGDRTPPATIYRFRVPEPGIVTLGRIERLSGNTPFVSSFWPMYGTNNSSGRDEPCDTGSVSFGQPFRCDHWSGSPLNDVRDREYVRKDLTLAIAHMDNDRNQGHKFPITFEPTCGNGRIEDGEDGGIPNFEECEDGARASGDGCSASCKIEAACDLDVRSGSPTAAPVVVTLPSACRTTRVKADLAPQATILLKNAHPSDSSVTVSVDYTSATLPFRGERPSSAGAPWLGIAIGPHASETANWSCLNGEACNERQCTNGARACRVRYTNAGGESFVRVSNAAPINRAKVTLRIDRNLASVYQQ